MAVILRCLLLYVPAALLSVVLLVALIVWQRDMVSKDDLEFLIDLGHNEGLGAVVSVVRVELYGVDESATADPSYGRVQIAGRGHAPWVIRGNLDGRPRMLKFALAPQLWAAYDTGSASLYQVWQGSVLFEGAAYDYRHGPQPVSQGKWYYRQAKPVVWFLQIGREWRPAEVEYLGHQYGAGQETASYHFNLRAGGHAQMLSESPDVIERDGQQHLRRSFDYLGDGEILAASFVSADGQRHVVNAVLDYPLTGSQPIDERNDASGESEGSSGALSRGESVIANGDCLGCHNATQRVVGPSWAEIAGRYRGKLQAEVVSSLSRSVKEGVEGRWASVPMPPHPEMPTADIEAAVAYILKSDVPDGDLNPPLDSSGKPYVASRRYQINPRLEAVHPAFSLENLAPTGFEPKVGGMDFRADGKLLVASWDKDGAVYLLDLAAPEASRVKRIAEGLHEPLGLKVVGGRVFVLQKQELTELVDHDGDDVIDEYRVHSNDWPTSSNFHSFAFGLIHQSDHFAFLLSICILPGGASCPEQLPSQGKLMQVDMQGNATVLASGFRTPNGINVGPDGDIYVTDNQGDWLPASKLVRIVERAFYGSRAVADPGVMDAVEKLPVVWLPQDEIGNSPTQPLSMIEGPYRGQMIHGDVYNGGIKRVYMEEVEGAVQGAVFPFSSGFMGSVNRLLRGPDGAIYVGELGNPPNWGEYGKPWYGLERMVYSGEDAFEVLRVEAREDGFLITLTQPLAPSIVPVPAGLQVKQWFYHPTEQYGGPKYDEQLMPVNALEVSTDRRQLKAVIPGLKAGYVVYLHLDDGFVSPTGEPLWVSEAWYTLNAIPGGAEQTLGAVAPEHGDGWRALFDGSTLRGWRNYGGDENTIEKWSVNHGELVLQQEGSFPLWDLIYSSVFGGASGDLIYYQEKFKNFELELEWKISKNGNSGIFYLVQDETQNAPWLTGIEMQVLDNEGHADGKIVTHRAGDLYDLIAAEPQTVKPPGQWNKVRIRVDNNHIEHWLNGEKVVSVERDSEEWRRLVSASKFADMPGFGQFDEGYIVLQDHGDPVWYRNIRVRTFGD